MQLNIAGQTVVVLGAANGIGRATAAGFLAEGCRVHGFDRDPLPPVSGMVEMRSGDAPGMVRTALNEAVWAAGQRLLPASKRQDYVTWADEKIRKVAPLGRWQQPEDFAAMAVFLASEHARNITGQTLNIDGGQVMHA
jgi:NAD(P)-dependent dehydrogenase (short-subunit alcohol dehydrogenase family)